MLNLSLARPTWQSHLRAVLAIARKNWLHFLRYPLNAVFQIVQPVMWLTPVYFLGRTFATAQGNVGFAAYTGISDYMAFIIVGSIISSYISAVFWGMGLALKTEMDSGVLESNWMTPVPRPLLLVGQTLANLGITTLNCVLVCVLAWLLFGFSISGNLLAAALTLIPMLVALYGFGFAFAALVLLIRESNTLIDVSDFVISTFSGSRFPVMVLPRFLLPISLAIPLTYGLDAVRGLLLNGTTLLPIGTEIIILCTFMLVMVPTGYGVFKLVERRCRIHGTLGMH
jgi:ABC-2 type transport system permease protein